ncbi:MAG: hypothetical protein GY756_02880, partial [bacterium]|nr:hypothetical protein [bacterium]
KDKNDPDSENYKFKKIKYDGARSDWNGHRSVALEIFYPEGISGEPAILVHNKVIRFSPAGFTPDENIYIHNFAEDLAITGNVTDDGNDNIIIQQNGDMVIYGYKEYDEDKEDNKWEILKIIHGIDRRPYTSICVVNTDRDSDVLKYLDRHEIFLSDPQILAVLASPPYMSNFNQNLGSMSTTFGSENGSSTSTSNTFGISIGYSVGIQLEAPLFGCDVICVSASFNFDLSFDYTTTQSSFISVSKEYTCPAGEDQVILMCIPYDSYYYEVISSPDQERIGAIITLNMPRAPETLSFERNYYNNKMGELGFNELIIGDEILDHKIGDVVSYPDTEEMIEYSNDKDNFLSSGDEMLSPPLTTTDEGASTGLSINWGTDESTTLSFDVAVSSETEITTGGYLFGSRYGMHYGFEYEVTESNSFAVSCSIAGINDPAYNAGDYSIGLMTYQEKTIRGSEDSEDPKNLGYIVVNYWQKNNY